MKLLSLLMIGAICGCPPVLAHAQGARFTDGGRLMLNGSLGGRVTNRASTARNVAAPQWEAFAQPSVTYFLADRMGAGFSVGGSFVQRKEYLFWSTHSGVLTTKVRSYELWFGPDATFEVPVRDRLSMMVLPEIYYRRVWQTVARVSASEMDSPDPVSSIRNLDFLEHDAHFLRFALRLPLVAHVSSSVAIGLGPVVWCDLFLSQDPAGKRVPIGLALSPGQEFVYRSDPYPRSRWVVGLTSWIGGSF